MRLDNGFSKQIELYTNNCKILQFDEKDVGILQIEANQITSFSFTVISHVIGNKNIVIHCRGNQYKIPLLDYNSKEILARWLINLEILKPNLSFQYNIQAPAGEISQANWNYENKTEKNHQYIFSSSDEEVVHIPKTVFQLEPGEKIVLPVVLKAMRKNTQAVILIYVIEEDTGNHEALVFNIKYI